MAINFKIYGQTTGKWIFEVKKIISTFLLIPLPPGKSHHYPPGREKFFIGKHFFKNIILPTEQMGDIAYSFIPFWGEHIFLPQFNNHWFSLMDLLKINSLYDGSYIFRIYIYINREYSKNLGQHSIMARKDTFYDNKDTFFEKRAPRISPPSRPTLFNPFSKCFASK